MKRKLAFLALLLAFMGCQKESAPKIVSTREVTHDDKVIVEATFKDGKQLYFQLLSPNTASVTSGWQFSQEAGYYWKCYGGMVIPSEFEHNEQLYSVTCIENSAFQNCNKLSSITIPNSVTSIGEAAFMNCSDLQAVELPTALDCIRSYTFAGCKLLSAIDFPERLRHIESCAFSGCEALSSIKLPESLEFVGGGVFEQCIRLVSVEMGSGLKTLPEGLFDGCCYLTEVKMPAVERVNETAFRNCTALQSIELPATLQRLKGRAFVGCSLLTSVTCHATTPPSTYYDTEPVGDPFQGCPIEEIKVPMASASTYRNTLGWRRYADKIVGM